ncbi:hypothetical protein HRED_08653 [Candidatus Haloredivivus sp. G17]|nr:hypothetical protein HRED_08653 [Candidatus Haloredivivus sp. G17]
MKMRARKTQRTSLNHLAGRTPGNSEDRPSFVNRMLSGLFG